MIVDLKAAEVDILEKIKNAYIKNKESFNYDGLVLRGKVCHEDGNWFYSDGDEEQLWKKCKGYRIMVLSKDLPNDYDQDIRTWTGRDNDFDEEVIDQNLFYQNLIRWVVGINSLLQGNEIKYNELSEKEWLARFDRVPLVRINVKKNEGVSQCSLNVLAKYIDKYKNLLQEQISLYEADVILCCGFENDKISCITKLLSDIIPDLKYKELGFRKEYEDGKWILTGKYEEKGVIVVNMYHPSSPGTPSSIKMYAAYNDLMENLKLVLTKRNTNY